MANFVRDRNKPRRRIDRHSDGSVKAIVTQHFKSDRQDVNVVAKPVRARTRTQES